MWKILGKTLPHAKLDFSKENLMCIAKARHWIWMEKILMPNPTISISANSFGWKPFLYPLNFETAASFTDKWLKRTVPGKSLKMFFWEGCL